MENNAEKKDEFDKTIIIRIIGSLLLIAFLAFIWTFVTAFALLFRMRYYYEYSFYCIVVPLSVLIVMLFMVGYKKTEKVLLIIFISTTCLVGMGFGGTAIYYSYYDSLRIIDNSAINTSEYLPFKQDSKIARLDKEASLKLTSNLPIVDGAAALFPMYSSFVNAVYPSSIDELNYPTSPFQYHNTIDGYINLFCDDNDIMFGTKPDYYSLYGTRSLKHTMDDLVLTPIGREGFVFFTNIQNNISSLTRKQIADIYSGNITNWSVVGGANQKIMPYHRNAGSGSEIGFENFFPDVKVVEGPTEYVSSSMGGIIQTVADYHNYPGAIGFSYYHYATQIKANNNIKIIAVDGVDPNSETIGNASYPLVDNFYASTIKTNTNENIDLFINWIISSEGQELVEKSGYCKLS